MLLRELSVGLCRGNCVLYKRSLYALARVSSTASRAVAHIPASEINSGCFLYLCTDCLSTSPWCCSFTYSMLQHTHTPEYEDYVVLDIHNVVLTLRLFRACAHLLKYDYVVNISDVPAKYEMLLEIHPSKSSSHVMREIRACHVHDHDSDKYVQRKVIRITSVTGTTERNVCMCASSVS